ncbi:MAG: hypothetical protein IPG63_13540 [Xanthomonadales bacterium]|nr:hypothetical protein [Xanthomonadales bacterium]
MNNLDEMQKRLKAIAEVINAFKSEAVQLRVVEVLLGQIEVPPALSSSAEPKPSKRTKRRKASTKTGSPAREVEKTQTQKPARKTTRASASPGAFAMISQLLGGGFFKTPKTIGAIVTHCGTSKGHHYKANECSPALLRLLRDGKLRRGKNKDGQYEYTQA